MNQNQEMEGTPVAQILWHSGLEKRRPRQTGVTDLINTPEDQEAYLKILSNEDNRVL